MPRTVSNSLLHTVHPVLQQLTGWGHSCTWLHATLACSCTTCHLWELLLGRRQAAEAHLFPRGFCRVQAQPHRAKNMMVLLLAMSTSKTGIFQEAAGHPQSQVLHGAGSACVCQPLHASSFDAQVLSYSSSHESRDVTARGSLSFLVNTRAVARKHELSAYSARPSTALSCSSLVFCLCSLGTCSSPASPSRSCSCGTAVVFGATHTA